MIRILALAWIISLVSLVSAHTHDAELVRQETTIKVEKGKLFKTEYFELKINNRGGEIFTKVSIPQSKLSKTQNIEAYIKDRNGIVVKKLKKGDVKSRSLISDFSFYEDNYVSEFTLKHDSYPYTLIYSYRTLYGQFLFLDYWLPVISKQVPTSSALLRVEVPLDYKLYYYDQRTDSFRVDTIGNSMVYQWTASYTDILRNEIHSPPTREILPYVSVVPQDFVYDLKGSFNSWIDFGNWQVELMKELSDLPLSEKIIIDSLLDGVEDTKEKIRILYHHLQDKTRYINISLGTGGFKPYPASYVARNKYGDCKALSNYFMSVLNYADIKSYYTIVHAGEPIEHIKKEFPSQQFNHIILCIPLANDTVWLDCTSKGPFNYLGTSNQNRYALIIDKDKSRLVKTPALASDNTLEFRKVMFNPDTKVESVIANFQNTYNGNEFETMKYLVASVSESRRPQIMRNHIVEKGFELNEFNLDAIHRDSTFIHLEYSAQTNRFYSKYGNEILIKLLPFDIPSFEVPSRRKLPVQLDYPIYKIDSLEYSIPAGYKVLNTMDKYFIESEFGHYEVIPQIKDSSVMITKTFMLHSGKYPVEKYQVFYEFVNKIKEIDNSTCIVLNKR